MNIPTLNKLSFSKKLRLLYSYEFTNVLKNPYKFITQEITACFTINNLQYPRIGIIITKKNVKYAYKRNNIKRHIRESFRIHQHILPKMDFVIITKKNIINLNNHSLNQKLITIWRYNYDANF